MEPIIYHNPRCGTSRNVLRALEAAGYAPQVVLYLQTGWTRDRLVDLFARAGVTPHQALRRKEALAAGLGDAGDDVVLDAMVAHPILVERPFVVTDKGVALCRPSEAVLKLIDRWPPAPFAKEDGSLMIDEDGKVVG